MQNLENKTTTVVTLVQGDAVASTHGYFVKGAGTSVVAFYVDGWGNTGRIYPMTTCSSIYKDGKVLNYPSMWVEDGDEDSSATEIYFPEFEDYDVFASAGGKTMSVCLVKQDR